MGRRYIKNKGVTKLVIKNNSKKDEKTFKWNVDYDGDEADIELDIKDNRNKKHYNWKLDNDDLAKLLNVPSIEKPIDQRLRDDFLLQDAVTNNSYDENLLMPLSLESSSFPEEPQMKVIVLNGDVPRSKGLNVIKISPRTKRRSTKSKRKTSRRRSSSRSRSRS